MTRSHLPSTAASAASRPVTFAWMSLRTRYLMASVSSEARAAHYRRHAAQMPSARHFGMVSDGPLRNSVVGARCFDEAQIREYHHVIRQIDLHLRDRGR